jgi:hypothetical protein
MRRRVEAKATVKGRVRIEVGGAAAPVFEVFLDGWPLLLVDLGQGWVRVNDLRASHAYTHVAPLPACPAGPPLVETDEGRDGREIMVVLAGIAAYVNPCEDRPTHAEVQVVSLGADRRLLLDCEVRYRQLPRRVVASLPGAGGSTG